MSLFDPPIDAYLTPEEWKVVTRPVNGAGGSQILLRRLLQDNVVGPRTFRLELSDLARVHRYAHYKGGGGYEDRFLAIERGATRTGLWRCPDSDPPSHLPPDPVHK